MAQTPTSCNFCSSLFRFEVVVRLGIWASKCLAEKDATSIRRCKFTNFLRNGKEKRPKSVTQTFSDVLKSWKAATLPHILLMTRIVDGYGIIGDCIGIVPPTCMRHKHSIPSFKYWRATWNGLFNTINSINRFVDVFQSIRIRISIWIFQCYILIERTYLLECKGPDVVFLLHAFCRKRNQGRL